MILMKYSTNIIIQYSIIALVLLAACGWIIWKLFKRNQEGSSGSCCGCSLSKTCEKNKLKNSDISKK